MRRRAWIAYVALGAGALILCATVFSSGASAWQGQGFDLKASMARGKTVYDTQCVTCHQPKGEGMKGVYPPLAKSNFLMSNKARAIGIVVNGSKGVITVNGAKYDNEMLSSGLTDQQVSDVLNYVRNSWGNKGEAVKPEEVTPLRKKE